MESEQHNHVRGTFSPFWSVLSNKFLEQNRLFVNFGSLMAMRSTWIDSSNGPSMLFIALHPILSSPSARPQRLITLMAISQCHSRFRVPLAQLRLPSPTPDSVSSCADDTDVSDHLCEFPQVLHRSVRSSRSSCQKIEWTRKTLIFVLGVGFPHDLFSLVLVYVF